MFLRRPVWRFQKYVPQSRGEAGDFQKEEYRATHTSMSYKLFVIIIIHIILFQFVNPFLSKAIH